MTKIKDEDTSNRKQDTILPEFAIKKAIPTKKNSSPVLATIEATIDKIKNKAKNPLLLVV
ncbi:MAG: hypothetical protein BHV79_15500 [Bacteroides uniformis]|uniref:Uncharacterized protein n=1 Tax=Bacteroides uniformis TaxID=820 RepID=A0A1Q6HVL9_BACUN|nr:MAG: hypothetical protein BHV79_15500 [Bacteroides uniformis]